MFSCSVSTIKKPEIIVISVLEWKFAVAAPLRHNYRGKPSSTILWRRWSPISQASRLFNPALLHLCLFVLLQSRPRFQSVSFFVVEWVSTLWPNGFTTEKLLLETIALGVAIPMDYLSLDVELTCFYSHRSSVRLGFKPRRTFLKRFVFVKTDVDWERFFSVEICSSVRGSQCSRRSTSRHYSALNLLQFLDLTATKYEDTLASTLFVVLWDDCYSVYGEDLFTLFAGLACHWVCKFLEWYSSNEVSNGFLSKSALVIAVILGVQWK